MRRAPPFRAREGSVWALERRKEPPVMLVMLASRARPGANDAHDALCFAGYLRDPKQQRDNFRIRYRPHHRRFQCARDHANLLPPAHASAQIPVPVRDLGLPDSRPFGLSSGFSSACLGNPRQDQLLHKAKAGNGSQGTARTWTETHSPMSVKSGGGARDSGREFCYEALFVTMGCVSLRFGCFGPPSPASVWTSLCGLVHYPASRPSITSIFSSRLYLMVLPERWAPSAIVSVFRRPSC